MQDNTQLTFSTFHLVAVPSVSASQPLVSFPCKPADLTDRLLGVFAVLDRKLNACAFSTTTGSAQRGMA